MSNIYDAAFCENSQRPHLFSHNIIIFAVSLPYEINMNNNNTVLIFTPEVSILCKKVGGPKGPGAMDFDIPNC